MNISNRLALVDKLLSEQGKVISPSEIRGHLLAIKEQLDAVENERQNQITLKAKCDAVEAENIKLKAEDVFCHKTGIVFKRSKNTGNQWRAFCPHCNAPVVDVDFGRPSARACCTKSPPCGQCFEFQESKCLEYIIKELPA